MNIIEHYDKLIDENNDPIYNPEPLKEYMNKWDGKVFIDAMKLDKMKTVLEIGVGTGRLAVKTIPLCNEYINYGDRKIKIYPDNPDDTKEYFINSGLSLLECIETEFAYIFVGLKI